MTAACLLFGVLLAAAPVFAAERPAWPAPASPDLLPGDAQAASVSARQDSWLVGATPDAASTLLARRHGAELLMADTGIYRISRGRARRFAAALKRAGRYQFAEPDALAEQQAFPADPLTSSFQWSLGMIGVHAYDPPPVTATSPLIGVLESGLDQSHPDLQGVGLDGSADPNFDPGSVLHGTAVASVAAAPVNGHGIVGLWPGARATVFSSDSSCGGAIDAIFRAIEAGAKVLNMSYGLRGGGCFAHYIATQAAYGAGAVLVAAAGNDFQYGNPQDVRPGTDPHVITVGAIDQGSRSAGFSNENFAIDLSAPGVGVLAAVPVAYDTQDGSQDGYMFLDGTSFSAPIVAAGAGWVMQQRPRLHNSQVTDLLRYSAVDLGRNGWDPRFGFGLFDISGPLISRAPGLDPLEPNDDVGWVNGRFFARPDPAIWSGGRRGVYLDARIDRLEDPFDVYRVSVPGRSAFHASIRPGYGDPQLEAYNAGVRTVTRDRGLITGSYRSGRAGDGVYIYTNARRRGTIYLSVWSETLDAGYRLKVRRASYARVRRLAAR